MAYNKYLISSTEKFNILDIKFNEKGLIPVVAQCVHSGKVLMMAWMNEEAVNKTIDTNNMHYFSRSRQTLW